jgi:hypothetical protein
MTVWKINEIIKAIETIRNVVESPTLKRSFGARQRKIALAEYEKTGRLTGYRVEWMRKSYGRFLQLLSQLTKEFNGTFPHDTMTTDDQIELLVYVFTRMRTEQKLKKD